MKTLGGYFELELSKGTNDYHTGASTFKSGRSSLMFILERLQPSNVYIPFYSCDSLIEPFQITNTPFTWYPVNKQLEPLSLPELKDGEYFLYINYFDLKREFCEFLSGKYESRLIIDCTQAFFMKGNGISWYFNSCRKFFGTPDGSYLYIPNGHQYQVNVARNGSYSVDHLLMRFDGNAERGYASFLENERLCGTGLEGMSRISEYLLSNVDYEVAIKKRKSNFSFLYKALKQYYLFEQPPDAASVPMVYPALMPWNTNRQWLNNQKIYIPCFWDDVLHRKRKLFKTENLISRQLFPLPIDHRYAEADMQLIEYAIRKMK